MAKKREKLKPAERQLNSAGTGLAAHVPGKTGWDSNKYIVLCCCALLFIYYWYTSTVSEGLYQHDEAGHMIDMLSFWNHPLDTLISLWSRGGYKILYSLSAWGGPRMIVLTNICFTTGAALLCFLTAKQYGLRQSWLAIFLFGLQPFIINLSFRCYAEVPTMFFSVLLLFLYTKKKYWAAAITASFLFTLRQEMAVFSILLGIYFLFNKKWMPLLLLLWAPLMLDLLGWIKTGNPLFVVQSVLQGGVTDTYQRNGFFYLWLMLPEITGVLVVALFIAGYLSFFTAGKEDRWLQIKKFHAVILLFTVYFLMHCVFTAKTFGFGRSGGLGRFIIVVSPCIGIIALKGFNFFTETVSTLKKRFVIMAISYGLVILFLLMVKKIMPFVFNGFTVMTASSANLLFLLLSAAALALYLLLKAKNSLGYAVFLLLLLFFCTVATVKPLERGAEDETMKYATDWYWNSTYARKPVHTSHILFNYFSIQQGEHNAPLAGFDSLAVVNAAKGELFLYDNHYAYRLVSSNLFQRYPFVLIKDFTLPGSNFSALLLEKR